jgi:hypothetical protein
MIEQASAIPEQVSVVVSARNLIATPEELAAAEKQIEQRLASRRNRPLKREITGHDEASLSWYFGQGLSIYEKSTFGPIVHKIALDGFSSTECDKCSGTGVLEKKGIRLEDRCPACKGERWRAHKKGEAQQWCSTCDGQGVVPPYEVETDWGWCTSCRGTGAGCVEKQAKRRPRCRLCRPEPTVKDPETGDLLRLAYAFVPRHCCWNCFGTGDEPISAQPVQVADPGGGVLANDSALTSFAITSRRVDKVKQRSPALHAALEAFYGDSGARWALSDFGRLFSLYHLTPAGKRLVSWETKERTRERKQKLKSEKAKAKKKKVQEPKKFEETPHLLPQEAIWTQAVTQRAQPHGDRRKLFQAAHEQATELYQRAAGAWIAISTSKAELKRMKDLAEKLEQGGHERTATIVRLHTGAV